mgnify:CR=1 FL=1
MRALDLAVEAWGRGLDVDVADAPVEQVVVEGRPGLGPVVGLDDLDPEGQLREDLVDEADGRSLVGPVVDAQDPDAGAVVDGGELVVLLGVSLGAAR